MSDAIAVLERAFYYYELALHANEITRDMLLSLADEYFVEAGCGTDELIDETLLARIAEVRRTLL